MRRILSVTVLALALAALPRPALSCSCVPFTKPRLAESATLVFTGTVSLGGAWALARSEVEFAVERVYKGEVASTARVQVERGGGASCAYDFVLGRRYTVFARDYDGDGVPNTNLCFGPVEGDIDPAEYGLPSSQPPAVSLPFSLDLVLTALALGALAGAIFRAIRRRAA